MKQTPVDPRLSEIDDCLYRLSVKAIIVKENKLLVVKEQDDEWWSIPGGGIDYGETVAQALRREVSEELGVDPQTVHYDEDTLFIIVGAIVNGVPRANLFYQVQIPADTIKPTTHVLEHKWCDKHELSGMYLSPSTGNVIEKVADLLETE